MAQLTAFIGIARASLLDDHGVHLAPSERFPKLNSEGVATAVTYASGDDGVGGYYGLALQSREGPGVTES